MAASCLTTQLQVEKGAAMKQDLPDFNAGVSKVFRTLLMLGSIALFVRVLSRSPRRAIRLRPLPRWPARPNHSCCRNRARSSASSGRVAAQSGCIGCRKRLAFQSAATHWDEIQHCDQFAGRWRDRHPDLGNRLNGKTSGADRQERFPSI